jgi:hypothetical protein
MVSLRAIGRTGYAPRWSARVEGGRAVFEGLPAGEYQISGSGALPRGQMRVNVPGQTTVRYEPQTVNAYFVRIRSPEGYAAKAGLREGDLVVGIDGQEFTSEAQMGALLTLAREKEECALLVLRGRRTLTLRGDPKRLWGRDSGATLQPTSR